MSTPSAKPPAEVHYPESDGKPMGETGIHVYTTMEVFGTLKFIIFEDHPSTYVASDMFFYYEQGNPRAVKAPDIMVIQGVSHTEERRTFKLWVEKRVPSVVFEITSAETRRDDTVIKRELYARLGVEEYYLFDPLGEYLDPPLRGFRLAGDRYSPLAPGEDGCFESHFIGVKLRAEGTTIRFLDPLTNSPIPSVFEQGKIAAERTRAYEKLYQKMLVKREKMLVKQKKLEQERRKSARQAKKAEREAKKAEAERQKANAERQNAEREAKKAEAERQNAEREAKKAEAERQRAEAERLKAEAERQKAEALEAEVRRLRALLGERGDDLEG